MRLLKDTLPGMLRQLANDIEMGSASGAPVLDDVNFRVKGTGDAKPPALPLGKCLIAATAHGREPHRSAAIRHLARG